MVHTKYSAEANRAVIVLLSQLIPRYVTVFGTMHRNNISADNNFVGCCPAAILYRQIARYGMGVGDHRVGR